MVEQEISHCDVTEGFVKLEQEIIHCDGTEGLVKLNQQNATINVLQKQRVVNHHFSQMLCSYEL
jgi:hypothetical protein